MKKIKIIKIIGMIIAVGIIIAEIYMLYFLHEEKNRKLPRLKSIPGCSSYLFEQVLDELKAADEKEVIKAWGKPQIVGSGRVWSVNVSGETRYVIAHVEDGRYTDLEVTDTIYITVVEATNGLKYWLVGWDDFTTDMEALTSVHMEEDVFGNEIPCDPGVQMKCEYIGGLMESYPGQLDGVIYSYKITGHLSDSEYSRIVENNDYLMGNH